MPQVTELATGQLTESDSVTVELAVRDDGLALVKITWPPYPTVIDAQHFPDIAAVVVRLFSTAHVTLAGIKPGGGYDHRGAESIAAPLPSYGQDGQVSSQRPIGPWSLYWACRIQGANAYRAGRQLTACPYSRDREFSGRAWRDGWRAAASRAGVKMPHELASV